MYSRYKESYLRQNPLFCPTKIIYSWEISIFNTYHARLNESLFIKKKIIHPVL